MSLPMTTWVWDRAQYEHELDYHVEGVKVEARCNKCSQDACLADACRSCGQFIHSKCRTSVGADCFMCQAGTPTVPPC